MKNEQDDKAEIVREQETFKQEVIGKWEQTPEYQEFSALFWDYSIAQKADAWQEFQDYAGKFFMRLSQYIGQSPALPEVQKMVLEWQNYVSEHFFSCSKETLLGLGKMYVADKRFADFIDRSGCDSLAEFFKQAIQVYCR